jgi:transcriptional regulator with XRE-family HTH domain
MNDFIPVAEPKVGMNEGSFSSTENASSRISMDEASSKMAESGEEMIRRILTSYDIGSKLRQLRLRKKIALVDLGKHTGLSASMLSQLENGKLIPTLPTLARISTVFDVGLEFFFSEKRQKRTFAIVRAGERIRFPELSDSPVPGYYFEVLAYGATDKVLSAYLADFPPVQPEDVHAHHHEGAEFVHVVSGTLALNYDEKEYVLETGDSVYFDSSGPHSYLGKSDPPAKAIVVTTAARP